MSLPSLSRRPGRTLSLALIVLAGLGLAGLPNVAVAGGAAPVMLVAQDSRDAAQLTLRIQDLEQQVRDLTGQVQGLQFQLTQLQTLLDRSNQDNDFRFKALEGGKGGAAANADAGQQSGSLAAPAVSPAAPAGRPSRVASATPAAAASDQGGDDSLGPSSDPLVGKGRPGAAPGSEEVPLGASPGQQGNAGQSSGNGQPKPGAVASIAPESSSPEAQAQYKTGYDAIIKGNYSVAADQFKQFVKTYPSDPQAPDATNWLGEALLQQQDYVDAADVLVTGYKSYPNSPRAPDMLLKLGIALAGAQQPVASCKAFNLLAQKYPNTTTAFKARLKQEMTRDRCPS